jgi:hypothetical protein
LELCIINSIKTLGVASLNKPFGTSESPNVVDHATIFPFAAAALSKYIATMRIIFRQMALHCFAVTAGSSSRYFVTSMTPRRSSEVKVELCLSASLKSLAPASPIALTPRLSDVMVVLCLSASLKSLAPATPI